jgi:hypothetical protein
MIEKRPSAVLMVFFLFTSLKTTGLACLGGLMRVIKTMQATSSMFCETLFYTMSRPVKYGLKWIALDISLNLLAPEFDI